MLSANLEKEDVFPTWARKELQSQLADAPLDGQWPPRVILRACKGCNEGLGREFEDPAAPILKPLMQGEINELNRAEMAILGRWAWLKDIECVLGRPTLWTLQGQVTHTDQSLAFWRGELAKLRATGRPPRGYVARLAVVCTTGNGSFQSFVPTGWRREQHVHLAALNQVGLLLIESLVTTRANAARFVELTRHDSRATVVWPHLRRTARIGTKKVPLNHVELWRAEHRLDGQTGWGGGWRIPIPPST